MYLSVAKIYMYVAKMSAHIMGQKPPKELLYNGLVTIVGIIDGLRTQNTFNIPSIMIYLFNLKINEAIYGEGFSSL